MFEIEMMLAFLMVLLTVNGSRTRRGAFGIEIEAKKIVQRIWELEIVSNSNFKAWNWVPNTP